MVLHVQQSDVRVTQTHTYTCTYSSTTVQGPAHACILHVGEQIDEYAHTGSTKQKTHTPLLCGEFWQGRWFTVLVLRATEYHGIEQIAILQEVANLVHPMVL